MKVVSPLLNFRLARLLTLLPCVVALVCPQFVWADQVVRIAEPRSQTDKRQDYHRAVLTEALEKTVPTYGGYSIEFAHATASRKRALSELISGKNINVHMVATQIEWEEKTIPIRIPIMKGLQSYKLFLINRQSQETFQELDSLQELKSLRIGLNQQWSVTIAMKLLKYNTVLGTNYEGLFKMFERERFDYLPRGIHEIFVEFDHRKQEYPGMVIEPSKALYLPSPIYIFVSPKFPALAERIESGLRTMSQDGSLDRLFCNTFRGSIERANLAGRHIFMQHNPALSPETPINQKNLWFDPDAMLEPSWTNDCSEARDIIQ